MQVTADPVEQARTIILSNFQNDKLTENDMIRFPVLVVAANQFVNGYRGDFEFLRSIQQRPRERRSDAMLRGALNCLRAEVLRNASAPAVDNRPVEPEPRVESGAFTMNGVSLPDGKYTVVAEDGSHVTLSLRKSTWGDLPEGTQKVKVRQGSDYVGFAWVAGKGIRFWKGWYHSPAAAALRTLLDPETDWKAAGRAYAVESGNCYHCGRELTDPESVARGLGPDCAKVVG